MKIINKLLSREEFKDYIESLKTTRKIDKIVLHHTHSTIDEWESGERSVVYYKRLYEEKGWESGPHFFVASEGIWLFTNINTQGTHANEGNKGSIGVEMVGRYNTTVPSGEVWKNIESTLRVLLERFGLSVDDIHLHREYNPKKLCPGRKVTKKWLEAALK